MTGAETLLALLVGGSLGFMVGLERQLSLHSGDGYAGARTFALYGMWGAVSGYLGELFGGLAVLGAIVAFGALLVSTYWASVQFSGDRGSTTEAAALLVFAGGLLAWEGLWTTAIGVTVAVTALLRAKEPLHSFASRFSEDDVRSVLQFGVVTAVVLPLVPDEQLGAFDGFNPREVWLMVVFVSAIGLAGYVALRLFGARGLGLTGLLGGLVSSTAVTMSFSRMARDPKQPGQVLAVGVLAACGLMYVRVLIEAVVLAPALAGALAPFMVAAFLIVEVAALIMWLRSSRHTTEEGELELRNPLTLTVALAFGVLYAVVTFVSHAAVDLISADSLALVGALSGINDVDAITLSMGNFVRSGFDVGPAAEAVLAAVTVNAVVKAGLVVTLGSTLHARRIAPILGLAALVTGITWALS